MSKFAKKCICATALSIFSVAFASSVAFTQLAPPASGGRVVNVSSPSAGSRVSGEVPVTASLNTVGQAIVTAVQFKLNGFELGAEQTSPPYTVSWDTDLSSDGWHTLSAVARDAGGSQYSSDPVTVRVANTAPPPISVTRYEDTDPAVSFSPGWLQRNPNDWLAWSGGSAMQSAVPGATATFAFNGTSVTWIGYPSTDSGVARVLVDGFFVADLDLFALKGENAARVFTVNGLTNSGHILTIEVTGRKNASSDSTVIVVDAFDVPAPPISHLQETDPSVSYTLGWTGDTSKPWSDGNAAVSTAPGAQATLTFMGTAIRWIGYRGPETGIARVFLDGGFAGEVDTYSAHPRIQDTLFTATGLAEGVDHTVTIEATGQRNAESTDAIVLVDAFDITTGGDERFEQTDWAVTYTGNWTHGNRNQPWSEGTSSVSSAVGARAMFTFTGTSVSWIGFRAARTGIARVYLDGAFVTLVDTYAPTGEGFQNTVFTASGLASGRHTLMIEVTGEKNDAAKNNYVVVDAFDVGL
jgi:hypothetical protein